MHGQRNDSRCLARALGLVTAVSIAACAPNEGGKPGGEPVAHRVQGLSYTSAQHTLVAPHLGRDEMLLSVRDVTLTHTGNLFRHVKAIDRKTGKMRRFAIADGRSADARALVRAEHDAARAAHSGMSRDAFQRLEDRDNLVMLWFKTPAVGARKGLSKATLANAIQVDQAAFTRDLRAMEGVEVRRTLSLVPMVEIKATKSAIVKLAKHPSVVSIHNARVGKATTLGSTYDQDQMNYYHMFFPFAGWQSPITNEIKVAMVEECHPSPMLSSHLDTGNNATDRVNYLNVTRELNGRQDLCESNPQGSQVGISHADMTHSILYAKEDTQFDPPRGRSGMLSSMTRPVTSVSLSQHFTTGPGQPASVMELISALESVLGRAPGSGANAGPDVLSLSVWANVQSASKPEQAQPYPDLAQQALDWMTVRLDTHTLVVAAAGNDGYEPRYGNEDRYGWCNGGGSCKTGSTTENGGLDDCRNGLDDDGDGDVDCDDDGCHEHYHCKNRHYTIFKIRNGLVVGGAAIDPPGLGGSPGDPNYDCIGCEYETRLASHSSWRPPKTSHNDRRLPHVVASSAQPQAADHLWNYFTSHDFRWHLAGNPGNGGGDDIRSGTSFAAPQVAGMAAYAYRAALQQYPSDRLKALQAARAIVMASARHNAKTYCYTDWPGTNWADNWTGMRSRLITGQHTTLSRDARCDRDGAGMIDGLALGTLLNGGIWWMGSAPWFSAGALHVPPSQSAQSEKEYFTYPDTSPGTGRVRIALAWHPLATAESVQQAGGGAGTYDQGYDLDVCVYEVGTGSGGSDSLVACAQSWDNNYEFMDIDVLKGGQEYYTIVYMYSAHLDAVGTTVKYGLSHYFDAYHPPGTE